MNTSTCLSTVRASRGVFVQLAVIGLLGLQFAGAQSENFNTGTAPGWAHYDVGDIGGAYGVPGLGATYTFPPDGTGGSAYRIHSPPDAPYDGAPYGFGPSRALAFRPDVGYTNRFSVGVDLVAWDNTIDQAFGPCWFMANPGPGSTSGYVLTWEPIGQEILISRVDAEAPTTIGRARNVVLDPAQRYRFTASTHDGSTYLAQVFALADLDTPVAAAVASDASYTSGLCCLLAYDGTTPSVVGADATFDNYNATAPAPNSLRATIAQVSPVPNESVKVVYPTNTVTILDRETAVDPSSIIVWLDGNRVPAANLTVAAGIVETDNPTSVPNTFSGATVRYVISTVLPWGSRHTNSIAFKDSTGFWKTNSWAWTSAYPYLRAANSLPAGSFPFPGLNVRTAWTNGPTLGSSLARAEMQLANPPQIPYLLMTQTVVQVPNWNDAGDGTSALPFGYFSDPALVSGVPGLAPDGTHDNIACEIFAYLELTAGVHRFGVKSDDGFQLRSGNGPVDPNAQVLGMRDGATFDGTFDVLVEADGLYPIRGIWYENGGEANFQLFAVDLADPNNRVLVNDPNQPAGVVKAYLPLRLLSSGSAAGPYATETAAVIDTVSQTITVPMAGDSRYYRLQSAYPVTLTSVVRAGNTVRMKYQ